MKRNDIDDPKRGCRLAAIFLLAAVVAVVRPVPCAAQEIEYDFGEFFGHLDFSYLAPGARSTAMGGVSIGLTGDAYLASVNPAGLAGLDRSAVALDLKYLDYSRELYLEENSWLEGRRSETCDKVFSPAYIGYVRPWERFTLGVFRSERIRFEQSFFMDAPWLGDETRYPASEPWHSLLDRYRFYYTGSNLQMALADYGVSGAWQLGESWSVGASLAYSVLTLDIDHSRLPQTAPTTWYYNDVEFDDSGGGLAFNLGLSFRPTEHLAAGAVYRYGGEYDIDWRWNHAWETPEWQERTITFDMPEAYGVGISWLPVERLTVAFDVLRVTYSDVVGDLALFAEPNFVSPDDFAQDDATEVHFGLEWRIDAGGTPLFLRAGAFNDPDSAIRYVGTAQGAYPDAARMLYPGDDDQVHVTAGLGVLIRERLQLDLAADIADLDQQLSLSGVFSF